MRRLTAQLAVILLTGATLAPAQTSRPAPDYDLPRELATLVDREINEASGIVASRRMPGCFYVHNDSQNAPVVYLLDRQGNTRLRIHLANATNVDWEDMALAPGEQAGSWDVCVADIGDNAARRTQLTIYRFPEPAPPAGTRPASVRVTARAFPLRYADRPVDAEAFVVHPRSGDGYVLTKRYDGQFAVYKLAAPWSAPDVTAMPRIATVHLAHGLPAATVITAADIHPDGRRLAARSYLCGWEWCLPPAAAAAQFEQIFQCKPRQLILANEPQGEALCYTADGQAIVTVSEKLPAKLFEARSLPAGDRQP
ncbi:MAG: hypothetical protein KKB50_12200 [Planctomycetes bacterium]|nr:hypothetical protein [Planctomycetota bacterium]